MWVTHGPVFSTCPLYRGTWSDAAMTCPEAYGDSRVERLIPTDGKEKNCRGQEFPHPLTLQAP